MPLLWLGKWLGWNDTLPVSLIWWGHVAKVRSPANKEPFLNQLARVILVHNWYRSTSTCFHVYSCEYMCSACCHDFEWVWHESYWVRTGTVSLVRIITLKTHDFTVNMCRHTKFVHRIRWIRVWKHVHWASWTHEFTYRTCEITGRCLLGG